ncbi:glycine zipper 2TM domain-containing protein [Sphingomonas sp. RS2018]
MRKLILAATALAVGVPTAMTVPVAVENQYSQADAQKRARYREWKGRDGRYYCRKPNGTTGLVVGGVAGALVGRTIDSRGDRTLGTLLGAGAGALAGREIERSGSRKTCR